MDLMYFKSQINEELDGAKQYIEKAIEAKINHPSWSRTFMLMADMEAEHAGNLMKMMECYIRDMKKSGNTMSNRTTPITTAGSLSQSSMTSSMSETSSNPEDIYKDCMKKFGEVMTYVNNMKRGL